MSLVRVYGLNVLGTTYQKYKAVVDKLILSSGLDKDEFNRFFKRLRFRLGEPGRDLQKQRILDRLKRLGIERQVYDTFTKPLRRSTIPNNARWPNSFINQGLPTEERARLKELISRRDAETIIPTEVRELIGMTDRLEKLHAERLAALAELATLRGITLDEVINQLGIQFPDHD